MKYYLASRYKKYKTGGLFAGWNAEKQSNMESGVGLAGTAVGLLDSMAKTDSFGRKPVGVTALGGAAKGAMAGASLGPLGAIAGGAMGLAGGLISGFREKKANEKLEQEMQINERMALMNRSQAILAGRPELMAGNLGTKGFFAAGGPLASSYRSTKAVGGSLQPLSSESVEVQGPSHEQGGVQLPQFQAEVEGKETIHNDFVFSDALGFARDHKKIATAIGKIESKGAMTPERVNAINRLEERQENLKLSQEYLKQMMML